MKPRAAELRPIAKLQHRRALQHISCPQGSPNGGLREITYQPIDGSAKPACHLAFSISSSIAASVFRAADW